MSQIPDGLTTAEKQELLRDLKEAYFSGVTRVRFRERDVIYRSREEMKAIIDDLQQEMLGSPRRQQVVMTTFGRGR